VFFCYRWIAQTLIPLTKRVRFFFKVDFVLNFNYLSLGGSSFPCEQTLAQGAAAAHFIAPVREWQRKVTQIGLQRNNKYSFDREQPGLILNFLVALYKSGRDYMSPGAGADWATTPVPGLTFDDVVVFQPVSAVCVIMTSIVFSFFFNL
jgi:hypothetical protein